jgi:hypothetical protein
MKQIFESYGSPFDYKVSLKGLNNITVGNAHGKTKKNKVVLAQVFVRDDKNCDKTY